MIKALLIFSLFLSLDAFSQVKTLKIEKEKLPAKSPPTYLHSIEVCYGYLAFKDDFYKQLNTGNALNFDLPPRLIGIGVSGYELLVGPTYFLLQMDAQKYLPQTVMIHDSIRATYSGARFGMGIGKCFRSNTNNLSIACYLGFNSGRSVLRNPENISVQKPFFCPKISIQPKVMIKKIAFSLTITAQGDVTNLKWIPTYSNDKTEVPVSNLSQTGISAVLGLGYRFAW